jgi:peptidoglycan-associated lipoprotein
MQRSILALCAVLVAAVVAGCGPTYPKCDKDKDCKEKEFCVNGNCQQCRSNGDCAGGEVCNKGRCEPGAKSCSSDGDCGPDQSCINGQCKACASDGECGEGGKCNNGKCARATSKNPDDNLPPPPKDCSLVPVYFDFNESVLSTEATSAIETNADCLKKVAQRPVTLTGHTDPRGTEEYNLALSDKRAQSVKERLGRLGVDGARMKMVAKGELDATGTDESGWAKDRRVDVQW